jgi:hypothetical protein
MMNLLKKIKVVKIEPDSILRYNVYKIKDIEYIIISNNVSNKHSSMITALFIENGENQVYTMNKFDFVSKAEFIKSLSEIEIKRTEKIIKELMSK